LLIKKQRNKKGKIKFKKIIKILFMVFILTLILNVTEVMASGASYVAMNADVPNKFSYYSSSSRHKENIEKQLLEVSDTNRRLEAAIYNSDGTKISPSWKSFDGPTLVWFSNSLEQAASASGETMRIRIRSTNYILGGHIWAFWLPDPSAYGY